MSPVLPCVWIKLFIGALGILILAYPEPFFIDIFSMGVLYSFVFIVEFFPKIMLVNVVVKLPEL